MVRWSASSSSSQASTALYALFAASSILTSSVTAQIPSAEALNFASYQPVNVTCPSRSLLRNAGTVGSNNQSINPDEASYIERRRQNEVANAFQTFLADNKTGYDLSQLAPNASYCKLSRLFHHSHAGHPLPFLARSSCLAHSSCFHACPGPTVGIAVSGGGFRAALVGAGTFNALDGRNTTAVQAGTGGVWQLASYMTGLSGGSWFVSSLAINSNPSIYDLVLGSSQYQG